MDRESHGWRHLILAATHTTDTVTYLSLGSNMGDRAAQIEEAIAMIGRLPETSILKHSPLYESKPWGKTNQPDFLNMVVEISTNIDPHELLHNCKNIEAKLGREPGEQWGPRPIDIDILLYGDKRLKTDTLIIPHQRMWERQFVLRPLANLLPNLVGPDNTPIEKFLQREEIAAQGVREYRLERKKGNEEK
ncbi:MAG: 2-amino-4-hydroxy-6-hydroxymethyldihydropteridine diphosphokinase [Chloroflexia bacterium]